MFFFINKKNLQSLKKIKASFKYITITCKENEIEKIPFYLFFKDCIYLFLERGEGREKQRKRNISMSLPVVCPRLGPWPATQACALTENGTNDPFFCRPALNSLSHTIQVSFQHGLALGLILNVLSYFQLWLRIIEICGQMFDIMLEFSNTI